MTKHVRSTKDDKKEETRNMSTAGSVGGQMDPSLYPENLTQPLSDHGNLWFAR